MATMSVHLESAERLRFRIGADWVSATASEVEALIATLAGMREKMTPEVPRTVDNDKLPGGPIDPMWLGPSHPESDLKLLLIRHPGIGWLSFGLPAESAKSLSDYLSKGPKQTSVRPQTLQ